MPENTLLILAGIGLLASACQWFAWWVKLPAILFLLLSGILAGPVLGWLDPDALLGSLLFPIVSLSVAVILFEGSLTLKFDEIKGLEQVVRRMVSTGMLSSWAVTTLATRWLLGFSWDLSLLFGAVTVVTGPTVIVPLLRTVRPSAHLASILRWEGIVIDPLGALLAVLVFEFIISGATGGALGHTLLSFGRILLIGLVLGAAAGQFLGMTLRKHWLPEYLHNVVTLTLVFGVFAISDVVQDESGLLTVTVMGVWLANMRAVSVENILNFKESLSVLLISGLFILLAARVDFSQFQSLGWPALGVLVIMQFVARPLKIALCTWGSSLTWRERALLAWIAPRGIVAAAVAALFAMRLQEQTFVDAELLVPLTFMIIIGTVVLQSSTARLIATWLGVAEPEPRGFLIVGAGLVARAIAKALKKRGYDSLLCDNNWNNVRAARMDGLNTFYGNAVSEYADRRLDLVGIGRLLGLSPQRELNALAAHRYRREFGDNNTFTLLTDTADDSKRSVSPPAGSIAFGKDVSYAGLESLLSQDAEIRETKLSESFDFDAYYKKYYKKAIPLFALDPKKRLRVFSAEHALSPGPGWTLLSLIQKDVEPRVEEKTDAAAGNAAAAQPASS
jgi:NhaP-type Na+/H+ or K+/H+ antiporter